MISKKIFQQVYNNIDRRVANLVHTMCREDGGYLEPELKEPYLEIHVDDDINFDQQNSKGNFGIDRDGNVLLDLWQKNGSLPLGYNNDNILKTVKSNYFQSLSTVTRSDGNHHLIPQYLNLLEKTLVAISPMDMSLQHYRMEKNPLLKAIEYAGERYKDRKKEIWESSYRGFSTNQSVARKCFSVFSLEGSIVDRQNCAYDIHEIAFPSIKHSVNSHALSTNRKLEENCLENCFQKMKEAINSMKHPVAMVINPARYNAGMLSKDFFQTLQILCKEFDVAMIVNELDSGLGVTRKIWAHEHWQLPESPDMVVFGRKLLTTGFYMRRGFLPKKCEIDDFLPYDVTGLMLLYTVLDYICEENLLERVQRASEVLENGFKVMQDTHAHLVDAVYCNGTVCEIHFVEEMFKQEADLMLLNKGLNFGRNGDKSLFMRPPLIFNEKHATYIQDALCSVLHELDHRLMNSKKSI